MRGKKFAPARSASQSQQGVVRQEDLPKLLRVVKASDGIRGIKKEVAGTLQSGKAALFLLIRKMTTDKVIVELQGVGGKVLRSSFDETKEDALRAALAGVREAQTAVAGPANA